MSYYVVAGSKPLLKTLQKKFPADFASDLFIIYKELPPELNNCSVKVTTITDEEFHRIEAHKFTEHLKEGNPIICTSGNFKGMIGILRKVLSQNNGKAPICIVEISTGGGMRLVELIANEIEHL